MPDVEDFRDSSEPGEPLDFAGESTAIDRSRSRRTLDLASLGPRDSIAGLAVVLGLTYWVARPDLLTLESRLILGSLAVALGVSTVVLVVRGSRFGVSALAVGALTLISVIAPAQLSTTPRLAWESSLPQLAALAVFGFVAIGGIRGANVVLGLALTGLVGGLLAITGVARISVRIWHLLGVVDSSDRSLGDLLAVIPRAQIGEAHPNRTAMVLAGAVIAAVVLVWSSRGALRVGAAACLVVSLFALLLTGSRGGWAATVVGGAIAVFIRLREGRRWRTVLIATSLLLAATAALIGLYWAGIRPTALFRGTLADRVPVWEAGVRMFVEHPWFGDGAGAFGRLVDDYLLVYPGADARIVWSHVHSAVVDVLLERGAVGTFALLTSLALTLTAGSRRRNRFGAETALAVLAALLVHGLVEPLDWGIGGPMLIALVAGVTLQEERSDGNLTISPLSPRSVHVGLAVALGGLAPVLILLTAPGAGAYESGLDAALNGAWERALLHWEEAASDDSLPVYRTSVYLAELHLGVPTEPPSSESPFPLSGIDRLNHVLDPTNSMSLEALRTLERDAWADEVALLLVGVAYDERGLHADADRNYLAALEIDPWIASSPFWERFDDAGRLSRLLQDVIEREGCGSAPELFLLGDLPTATLEETASRCDGGWARMAALGVLGRSEELRLISDNVLREVPDSLLGHRFAGMAGVRRGDLLAARRHFAISALLGDPISAVFLADSYDTPPPAVVDLARALSGVHSPVIPTDSDGTLYRLTAWRVSALQNRETLPNPVIDGDWMQATTTMAVRLSSTR